MTLLLDTNAFIWWLSDDTQLGRRARADIANSTHKVYVSNLTLFEATIKQKTGKLKIDIDAVEADMASEVIQEVTYDTWAARQFLDLPRFDWADPFDAAIMAVAIAKHMTLVTSDQRILDSSLEGLHVMDARK